MRFQGDCNETIFISEIDSSQRESFNQDLKTGLSIVWNTGNTAQFMIDKEEVMVSKDCLIFLTEYHKLDDFRFESMNVIQFNRPFYCAQEDDSEVGCEGLLFFGASNIPKVQIPEDQKRDFYIMWDILMMEIEQMDKLQLEMLRVLLKRFLILSLRIYKMQNLSLPNDHSSISLIREFNYLVETHFRMLTKVSDYADLLNKSPKTITNTFKKNSRRSPLQVINDRRLLEARRLLNYTDHTVQEIADEINFKDIQSFSHFFKTNVGLSPNQYRKEQRGINEVS